MTDDSEARAAYWLSTGCVVDVGVDPLTQAIAVSVGPLDSLGHVRPVESIAVGEGPASAALAALLAEWIAEQRGLPIKGGASAEDRAGRYTGAAWNDPRARHG